MDDERGVPICMGFYPPAEITPREFEEWVAELFSVAEDHLDGLTVTLQDRISGPDGTYTFDATVRFSALGADFLVLVEAKQHNHPIKRDVVQVLHAKQQSVGAHKSIIVSTSPFQSGAFEYATAHGIALVTVTEGRFTFETRSEVQPPPLTRDEAWDLFGIPTFVGHSYVAIDGDTSRVGVSTISKDFPESLLALLDLDEGAAEPDTPASPHPS